MMMRKWTPRELACTRHFALSLRWVGLTCYSALDMSERTTLYLKVWRRRFRGHKLEHVFALASWRAKP